MKLLEFINKKTNNSHKDFKLVSVIFDEKLRLCTFKFLYKDTIRDNDKIILTNLIKEYINEDIEVVVKCKKSYIDEDLVQDVIYNFVIRNFNSIGVDFVKSNIIVAINNDLINVKIICSNFQYDYIMSNSIDKDIVNYANSFFFEQFLLDIEKIDSNDVLLEDIPVFDIDLSYNEKNELKYHKLESFNNFIGEVNGNPVQVSSIKCEMSNIEIAGTLKFLSEKSFESKRKDKEGNSIKRTYYSFSIIDKTGKINCVYFPNKVDLIKFQSINEGCDLVLLGDVEDFGGRLSFKVKSIAYGKIIDDIVEEKIEVIMQVNDDYKFVKPEPYIEIFQDNLFIEENKIGEYLNNNDVVVFDIETTGLEASKCEIIEIGAVKLHKGKIIETFETLIKPNSSIPEEITKLTGITEEMVKGAPSFKQVIPDFYKFCHNSTIMAYNIDFDYKFISVHSKKLGYSFNNPQIDVLYLARAFVPGLKNFKLSTVCKKLNVSLENAHRAVHDAMATAEVVIKLNLNIT